MKLKMIALAASLAALAAAAGAQSTSSSASGASSAPMSSAPMSSAPAADTGGMAAGSCHTHKRVGASCACIANPSAKGTAVDDPNSKRNLCQISA